MEVFESHAYQKLPFIHIVPQTDDYFIDFSTSKPSVFFRPIKYVGYKSNPIQAVRYFAVVSKDPEVLTYYQRCGSSFL